MPWNQRRVRPPAYSRESTRRDRGEALSPSTRLPRWAGVVWRLRRRRGGVVSTITTHAANQYTHGTAHSTDTHLRLTVLHGMPSLLRLSTQNVRDLALLLVRPIARFGRLWFLLEFALVFAFSPITHGRDLLWHAILTDQPYF